MGENKTMKAEEIKKAEEFLKKKRPQDFDDIPKWHIEDMIEFAQQFQLPSVSEEEIRLLKFIQRHLKIQKRNDTEQGFDKGFNERTLQHERSEVIEAASRLEKMLLSRLPNEQPVGKADKLEAEQPQEESEQKEEILKNFEKKFTENQECIPNDIQDAISKMDIKDLLY